jgi:hypothetical protein
MYDRSIKLHSSTQPVANPHHHSEMGSRRSNYRHPGSKRASANYPALLKIQLERNLAYAGSSRLCHLRECSRKNAAWGAELRMVENVEPFSPKLKVEDLRQFRILDQSCIKIVDPGPVEEPPPGIPF